MTTPTKQDSQVSTKNKQTPNATTKQESHQPSLKCPRCDSPNTKFCYFNNYSLTQPRHFCKTCRRYWTKGGALRNVPIGGGCRKNKKLRSSSSASSSCRLSGGGCDPKDYCTTGSSSLDFGGGFKLFHGLSPAMDFNLGELSFPRLNPSPTATGGTVYGGHFSSSFGDHHIPGGPNSSSGNTAPSPSGFSLDLLSAGGSGTGGSLLGFNSQPFSSLTGGFSAPGAIQEAGNGGGSMSVHTSLASSIESLSSINQDLHWKLQQQRLAMLLGGGGGGEDQNKDHLEIPHQPAASQPEKLQPILFQNLEISSKQDLEVVSINARRGGGSNGEMATEWFFGNSYGQVGASASTPTDSNSNGNESAGNWNNGVQASWGDHHHLHQYNSLS